MMNTTTRRRNQGLLFAGMVAVVIAASGCQSERVEKNRAIIHAGPTVSGTAGTLARIDGRAAFASAGLRNVSNAVVLAWTWDLWPVILAGRHEGRYVAAVAYGHFAPPGESFIPDQPYSIVSIQAMEEGGICRQIFATGEYDHPPTRDDMAALLKRFCPGKTLQDFTFNEGTW